MHAPFIWELSQREKKEPHCGGIVMLLFRSRCLVSFLSFFSPSPPLCLDDDEEEEAHKLHDIIIKLSHIASGGGGEQSCPIGLWLKMRKDGRMINKLPRVKLRTSDSVMSILFSIWLNQMSAAKLGDLSERGLAVPTSNSERVKHNLLRVLFIIQKTPSTEDLGNTWLNRHVLPPLQSVCGGEKRGPRTDSKPLF